MAINLLNIFFLTAGVWNTCAAKLCFIKQHPDPKHNFHMRWVLPYPKIIRCSCTKIHLHPCTEKYHISLPEAKDHFYTDEPLLFVKSTSEEKLQKLLECDQGHGRFKNLLGLTQITLKYLV